EQTEQPNKLYKLLTTKEFETQMEGVVLLPDQCKSSPPQLTSIDIAQIFEIFVLRLHDCNEEVKQKALEVLALMVSLLRDALHPVLVSRVPIITHNVNSKNLEIYAA
ncbi:TGRM2 protein, partial [Rhinopomastus cyanomelas]|nr:TGRM2 protein [Rhinopomastus cyanomelas]